MTEAALSFPIGDNIRKLRNERGISLSALARAAGISKAYLSQIENEPDKKPSAEVVYRLAQALEVTMADLMGVKEQVGPPPANNFATSNGGNDTDAYDPQRLPAGLRIFWNEHPQLPLEEIRRLAAVSRQENDLTATDYWLIYETIRLVTRPRHR